MALISSQANVLKQNSKQIQTLDYQVQLRQANRLQRLQTKDTFLVQNPKINLVKAIQALNIPSQISYQNLHIEEQNKKREQKSTTQKANLKLLFRIAAVSLLVYAFVLLIQPQTLYAVEESIKQTSKQSFGSYFKGFFHHIMHVDTYLETLIAKHGVRVYQILFAIIFAETGFVLTPFLPGDSLLFAAGALAASGKLVFEITVATILVAAILGDFVNYSIGHALGKKALESRFIQQKYIDKTNHYYLQYGGKTIVLARFVPIIRTFAPFVAGIGRMPYTKFCIYNVLGAFLWTFSFTVLGRLFGNLPIVKEKFTLVVLGIVVVSVLPMVFEYVQHKKNNNSSTPSSTDSNPSVDPNQTFVVTDENK